MPVNTTLVSFTALLGSKSYTLAYALPLLCLSLVLTFAGAFLTLDRTRSFVPRATGMLLHTDNPTKLREVETNMRRIFFLEGGVGGLATGYTFGVHLATFLALLVPASTSSVLMSPRSFLATWVLSATAGSYLAGRFRYATFIIAGVSGFSELALGIAMIIHPSLTTRVALTATFIPIGLLLCLLPIQRTQRPSLRLSMAANGAFSTVFSIALLVDATSWSDAWERLWVPDGSQWDSPQEKGLSAAFCLLIIAGCACDWFLTKRLGENPDQEWDNCLADYAANLPGSGRAGTFAPLSSFWKRHLGHPFNVDNPDAKEVIFPTDDDLKLPPPLPYPYNVQKQRPSESSATPKFLLRPEQLRKPRKKFLPGTRRTREAVMFRALGDDDLLSSDEDDRTESTIEHDEKPRARAPVSWTASTTTLADEAVFDAEKRHGSKNSSRTSQKSFAHGSETVVASDMPGYELEEEDVTTGITRDHHHTWTPAFLRRHSVRTRPVPELDEHALSTEPVLPYSPIPATPSLIRAIDRIAVAQQAAYAAPEINMSTQIPTRLAGSTWDAFWTDVRMKAGHGFK
ncbi:hypothetical protein CERSUDRAFT_112033 [Gelatoporia subvermispora B]|uniref:DUF4203 domain-containing protein n=1 Tax=Ceriporiopsis subvermispora (strain B) TaxID=914234 RepID=M2QRM7_CERS8|nr:hypothetical protein CERSUDRAFT_112033 [Gelatoporia subvermispora B]